jgi:hypothetical protein
MPPRPHLNSHGLPPPYEVPPIEASDAYTINILVHFSGFIRINGYHECRHFCVESIIYKDKETFRRTIQDAAARQIRSCENQPIGANARDTPGIWGSALVDMTVTLEFANVHAEVQRQVQQPLGPQWQWLPQRREWRQLEQQQPVQNLAQGTRSLCDLDDQELRRTFELVKLRGYQDWINLAVDVRGHITSNPDEEPLPLQQRGLAF